MGALYVLVVEDDDLFWELFVEAATNAGFGGRVRRAVTARQALGLLAAGPLPALVVLDLYTGDLVGTDAVLALRSNNRTKRLPVVILSGSTEEDVIDRAYEVGANSYLSKPFSFLKLNHLVADLLNYWLNTVKLPTPEP